MAGWLVGWLVISYPNRPESPAEASIKGTHSYVDSDPVPPNAVPPDPRAPVTTANP